MAINNKDIRSRVLQDRGADKPVTPTRVPGLIRTAQMRLVEQKYGKDITEIIGGATSLRGLERELTRKGVPVDFSTLSRWKSKIDRSK